MHKSLLSDMLPPVMAAMVCVTVLAAQSPPGPFEIGQRWRYRHEGPRPGSVEPNAIDGERVLWVLSAVRGPEGTQWLVEERFTRDERSIGRLCVGEDGLIESIEIENDKGEIARLRYDPPIPYEPQGMAVGDTRAILTTLRMDSANFALLTKTTTERLADESLATPAGDFADCPHYRSVTTSTIDVKIAKIPITEERERWYHPAIQGMVKEVYRRGPVKFLGWSRPGYTATSVLIAHDRQEPPKAKPVNPAGQTAPITGANAPLESARPALSGAGLILLAIVLLAAGGGFVFARRTRGR